MAVIWRRKGRGLEDDPDRVLIEARVVLDGLRVALSEFRASLDEFDAEVRQPDEREV